MICYDQIKDVFAMILLKIVNHFSIEGQSIDVNFYVRSHLPVLTKKMRVKDNCSYGKYHMPINAFNM